MGATCDETCESLGLSNIAREAAKVIQNGDCTLVQRFTNFAACMLVGHYIVMTQVDFTGALGSLSLIEVISVARTFVTGMILMSVGTKKLGTLTSLSKLELSLDQKMVKRSDGLFVLALEVLSFYYQ